MSTGNLPEDLSRALLVGTMLVGRLGVMHSCSRLGFPYLFNGTLCIPICLLDHDDMLFVISMIVIITIIIIIVIVTIVTIIISIISVIIITITCAAYCMLFVISMIGSPMPSASSCRRAVCTPPAGKYTCVLL